MTTFEIIILIIIYMTCYGYALAIIMKEENVWLRILLVIFALVYSFYVPLIFGGMLYEKMEGE